jgi:HAD superfamily hydrolase (TIGR01490 family)
MVTAAAVFDLDNTLVRGSSLFHFGVEMVRQRRLSLRHVLRYAAAEASYVRRRGEPTGIAPTIAERTLSLVAGMSQEALLDLAVEFAEHRLQRHLVEEVVLRVRDFQAAGYATFVATASPQELAGAIACTLGMSGAVVFDDATAAGIYTGRLCGPVAHGAAKAHRVQELFDEHRVDARASWAFSDSVNDLPLLMLVGNPVATNADSELTAIARRNGWRTLAGRQATDMAMPRPDLLYPF